MGCGGCTGCATAIAPKGCKNNGHCATGGCNKLNAYDWLGNMELPSLQAFNVVELKFKGGRKGFYRNAEYLELYTGDLVAVETDNGYHIGCVSLQGEIVRLQMIKKRVEDTETLPVILRKATEYDIERFEQARNREMTTLYRTRQIIEMLNLKMKLSDVEYQADNSKATFFYSADDRVDFRELIKLLAGEFRIRVEMRQISLRQEAGRLGGIGSCGRELCCSTWLTDFKSVPTSAARYQNLSLNPTKLSGQCGRLKCCLNYELETYMDALIDIPEINKPIKTQKGDAQLQKVDIFRKIMWFSFEVENTWYPVSADRARELLKLNKEGVIPESLLDAEEMAAVTASVAANNALDFSTGTLTDLDSFSRRGERPKSKRKKKKPANSRPEQQAKDPNADARQKPPRQKSAPQQEGASAEKNAPRRPKKKPNTPPNAPEANAAGTKERPKSPKSRSNKPRRPPNNKDSNPPREN